MNDKYEKLLKEKALNKPIFVGGIIPEDDAKLLLSQGVSAVFGPGSSITEISHRVKELVNL